MHNAHQKEKAVEDHAESMIKTNDTSTALAFHAFRVL